jgi:hypothetical protein
LLGHKIGAGVTERNYIERLRQAPDVSAVRQAMVEIGEEEARSQRRGPSVGSGDVADTGGSDARDPLARAA